MLKKLLLAIVLVSMVAAAFPADAGHESHTKNYIAGNGDVNAICGEVEDATDHCLGGAVFEGLLGGNYVIEVADQNGVLAETSGAYRIEGVTGTIDVCFPATTSAGVPAGGTLVVWIDGVVFWALGQPCELGQLSQGTTGTITVRHA